MKIGEALTEKKRLQSDLAKVNELIESNFTYKKGTTPDFNVEKLLAEQARLVKRILRLKIRVQKTNAEITVPFAGSDFTLQELIITLGDIRSEISVFNSLYAARNRMFRYSDDEVETVTQIPLDEIQKTVRALNEKKTKLDSLLQLTNWTIELI